MKCSIRTVYKLIFMMFLPAMAGRPTGIDMKNTIIKQCNNLIDRELSISHSEIWQSFDINMIDVKDGPEPGPNIIVISHSDKHHLIFDFQSMLVGLEKSKKGCKFEDYLKDQLNDFLKYIYSFDKIKLEKNVLLEGLAKFVCINSFVVGNMKDVKDYEWDFDAMIKIENIIKSKTYKSEYILFRGYKYGIILIKMEQLENNQIRIIEVDKISRNQ